MERESEEEREKREFDGGVRKKNILKNKIQNYSSHVYLHIVKM